jgi:hypothetical protein
MCVIVSNCMPKTRVYILSAMAKSIALHCNSSRAPLNAAHAAMPCPISVPSKHSAAQRNLSQSLSEQELKACKLSQTATRIEQFVQCPRVVFHSFGENTHIKYWGTTLKPCRNGYWSVMTASWMRLWSHSRSLARPKEALGAHRWFTLLNSDS